MLGNSENLLLEPSKFDLDLCKTFECSKLDLDLCMTGKPLAGLLDLLPTDRFPVDVADLSLLTSGFSNGGHGRGIFETQGVSGDGGAIICDDGGGPEIMPVTRDENQILENGKVEKKLRWETSTNR